MVESELSREVAESLAPKTAEYLLVAWRVLSQRKMDANYKIKTAIQGTDLHEFIVERWLQALNSDLLRNNPAFKTGSRSLPIKSKTILPVTSSLRSPSLPTSSPKQRSSELPWKFKRVWRAPFKHVAVPNKLCVKNEPPHQKIHRMLRTTKKRKETKPRSCRYPMLFQNSSIVWWTMPTHRSQFRKIVSINSIPTK